MKSIVVHQVILSFAALLLVPVGAVAADPLWTWEAFTYENDVWLRSYYNGQGMFDFRLGAGGAIAQMRDVQASYKRLLSPSYSGEVTDRIIQWTWWSDSITNVVAGLPTFEYRFNVTQGGTYANQISPTMTVHINPGTNIVDVYSMPLDQWKTQQQPYMQSKISALTRYEMAADGVLKVRRVMLVDHVYLHGAETQFRKLYVEGWSPFDRSGTFDGLALAVNANGTPTWWYKAGYNIPNYPNFAVSNTHGYAVVYKISSPSTSTAVGLVYGQGQVAPAGAGNTHVLNSMDWNNGIAILPALNLNDVALGSVIDVTVALVPRRTLTSDMASQLTALVPQIPAPVVYPSNTTFSGELAYIVPQLQANLNQSGQRTEHLAALIVTEPQQQITPAQYDFGTLLTGHSATGVLQIVNTGGSLLIGSVAAAAPFAVIAGGAYNLAAGQTGVVTVAFSPGAAGTFNADLLFASNAGNQTNSVTGTAITPYTAWQLAHFGNTNTPQAAMTANPSGDGLPNLMKYALGLDPNAASISPVLFEQATANGYTYLRLSVTRDPSATGVLIEGQSASTLTNWSSVTTVIESNTPSFFRVRDALPIESNPQRFLRLRFFTP
jgi:hypothetical protein